MELIKVGGRKCNQLVNFFRQIFSSPYSYIDNPLEVSLLNPETYWLIMNGTQEQQLEGTELVRKMLSVANPPIQDVIEAKGLLSKFVEFLDCHENERLQFEATWVLINIAFGSTEQTRAVYEAGAVPKLVELFKSPNVKLKENAVWAIANITCESKLVSVGESSEILEPLLKILCESESSQKLINESVGCLSNMCRRRQVSQYNFQKILSVVSRLLKTQKTNKEALVDLCWALAYLSNGTDDRIQAVIDSIDLSYLLELLEDQQMTQPVLRVFGNIVSGNSRQSAVVVQLGFMERLQKLIDHPNELVKIEVCWILSNLVLDYSKNQTQAMIDSGVILKAIALYPKSTIELLKHEIIWILGNFTAAGSREQIAHIVVNGGAELLLKHYKCTKSRVALESIEDLVYIFENSGDPIIRKCIAIRKKHENLPNLSKVKDLEKKAVFINEKISHYTASNDSTGPIFELALVRIEYIRKTNTNIIGIIFIFNIIH